MFQVCIHTYVRTYTRICELLWTRCYNIWTLWWIVFMIDCIYIILLWICTHSYNIIVWLYTLSPLWASMTDTTSVAGPTLICCINTITCLLSKQYNSRTSIYIYQLALMQWIIISVITLILYNIYISYTNYCTTIRIDISTAWSTNRTYTCTMSCYIQSVLTYLKLCLHMKK